MASQGSVARCALCGDELRSLRNVESRYRLERVDPIERLGELCADCGDGLFERRTSGETCLDCDHPADQRLTRLVLTESTGSTWQGTPDASIPLFCDDHFREHLAAGSGNGSSEGDIRTGPARG